MEAASAEPEDSGRTTKMTGELNVAGAGQLSTHETRISAI